MTRYFLCTCFILLALSGLRAQEGLAPLRSNLSLIYSDLEEAALVRPEQPETHRSSAAGLFLPFRDDFYYSTLTRIANPLLWRPDSSVFVNSGFPIDPPSIGVATFDGLNKRGYPYKPNQPNMSLTYDSDTLMSQPINLYTTASSQTLLPTDNVALSFYYQARGYGENPEAIDSLLVHFYKPKQNKWQRVWFSRGNANANTIPTGFKRGFVMIRDTAYFHDGFRFMFRNKATAAGNFDHWHVDYVYLNQGADSIADTTYNDLTFAYVPTPMLSDYSAMPYQQYNSTEMASSNRVWIRNSHTDTVNGYYESRIYDKASGGNLLFSYDGKSQNLFPFRKVGYSTYAPFANPMSHPTFTFDFPQMSDSAEYRIKHFLYRTGALSDFLKENDTIYQFHKFKNYYAFDDGGAEGGYYLNGTAAKLAVKIRVNVTDTLRAVRIYFDPAGPLDGASSNQFDLMVWTGNNAPISLMYKDTVRKKVMFLNSGFKSIPEYTLSKKQVLTPGTYFIGFQQLVATNASTGIPVGFDKNYDHSSSLFYDVGSGWIQSQIKGSIMVRPVLGKYIPPPVGTTESALSEEIITVFPNPTEGELTIRTESKGEKNIIIRNSIGQVVHTETLSTYDQTIRLQELPPGIYVLHVSSEGRTLHVQKIIIRR